MHVKFQVAGFQNKREIPLYKSLFSGFHLFILHGHLLVQVNRWFFASDAIEIQASVEDFRPVN